MTGEDNAKNKMEPPEKKASISSKISFLLGGIHSIFELHLKRRDMANKTL